MNAKPDAWSTATKINLVAAYPGHVPMGLPLPADEPEQPPTTTPSPRQPLCPWPPPTQ